MHYYALFGRICKTCSQPVIHGVHLEATNDFFHPMHLQCAGSSQPLALQRYVWIVDGKPWSDSCFYKFPRALAGRARRAKVIQQDAFLLPLWEPVDHVHSRYPEQFRLRAWTLLLVGLRLKQLRDPIRVIIRHLAELERLWIRQEINWD